MDYFEFLTLNETPVQPQALRQGPRVSHFAKDLRAPQADAAPSLDEQLDPFDDFGGSSW